MVRVLREWDLARSDPASPLARACALHLLCRDAGFLHDAGMMVLAGLRVCSMLLLSAVRVRVVCEIASIPVAPASPIAGACELHLLCRDADLCMIPGCACNASAMLGCWRWHLVLLCVLLHVPALCALATLLSFASAVVAVLLCWILKRRGRYCFGPLHLVRSQSSGATRPAPSFKRWSKYFPYSCCWVKY